MVAAAFSVALLGCSFASRRISPEFRARHGAERILSGLMIACSLIAILTTLGIVLSLLIEALRFFDRVIAARVLLRTELGAADPRFARAR